MTSPVSFLIVGNFCLLSFFLLELRRSILRVLLKNKLFLSLNLPFFCSDFIGVLPSVCILLSFPICCTFLHHRSRSSAYPFETLSFPNVNTWCRKVPSRRRVRCGPQILRCCVFTFIHSVCFLVTLDTSSLTRGLFRSVPFGVPAFGDFPAVFPFVDFWSDSLMVGEHTLHDFHSLTLLRFVLRPR